MSFGLGAGGMLDEGQVRAGGGRSGGSAGDDSVVGRGVDFGGEVVAEADKARSAGAGDVFRSVAGVDFGDEVVAEADKARLVGDVFRSVAGRYDLMNDVMSLGAHRLWKRFAVGVSGVRIGGVVLDVAGGSGDMARLFAHRVGAAGMVVLTDVNAAMLAVGRGRMIDAGLLVYGGGFGDGATDNAANAAASAVNTNITADNATVINADIDNTAAAADITANAAGNIGTATNTAADNPATTKTNADNTATADITTTASVNTNPPANVRCVLTDAEKLSFPADYFDCVSIAFGLRNVTNKGAALAEMCRVVRPGGRVLVLEFSRPVLPLLATIYERASAAVIPWLGERIVGDAGSYRYLVESIRRHPDQPAMTALLRGAGFDEVRVHNLSGGIVALHIGLKY